MSKVLCRSKHYAPPLPWDLDALPYVTLDEHDMLPVTRGVYLFRTPTAVLYIGQSGNLHVRLHHHKALHFLRPLPLEMFIAWMPLPHAYRDILEALERAAITHHTPLLNGKDFHWWKDPGPLRQALIESTRQRVHAVLAPLLQHRAN